VKSMRMVQHGRCILHNIDLNAPLPSLHGEGRQKSTQMNTQTSPWCNSEHVAAIVEQTTGQMQTIDESKIHWTPRLGKDTHSHVFA
jgi:hypothetical protein